MPHRKNSKGDIGTAKTFSDTYDADNIYLSEEGWVYRHFKNVKRTRWWDEIIVSGQVKPDMVIHGVDNGPGVGVSNTGTIGADEVVLTNPLKLGTLAEVPFQTGDGINDYRYSDHESVEGSWLEKVQIEKNETYSATGFDQIAWESIRVENEEEGDLSTQIPEGWNIHDSIQGVTDPTNATDYPDEPPYAGDVPQPEAEYTIDTPAPDPTVPGERWQGTWEDSTVGAEYAGAVPISGDDTQNVVDDITEIIDGKSDTIINPINIV